MIKILTIFYFVFLFNTLGHTEAVDPDLMVPIDLASYIYPEGKQALWGSEYQA